MNLIIIRPDLFPSPRNRTSQAASTEQYPLIDHAYTVYHVIRHICTTYNTVIYLII